VLTDQKVIDFFTNEMILAKVNGKEDTLLAQQHHIVAYPTLVMVDTVGDEVDRIVGYMEPDSFLIELRNYQKGIGTLADLLRKAEASPDRSQSFKIAQKYRYRDGREEAVTWYQKVIDDDDPRDSLSGESRMALADMHRRAKEYDFAALAFTSIMNDFEGTMFAEDAEVWRAIVYRIKADTTAAITAFEEFIEHYPESEDVDYAEKQIKKLKGETEEEK
jgi:tetratricopeptide (TPR) repeat protein